VRSKRTISSVMEAMTFGKVGAPRLLVLQANHRTRCHTIVSIYERVRGVIERDWDRQLAQKRHNLPSPQNGPSGPWVEPYLPKFWNISGKGRNVALPAPQPRFVPLVLGFHPRTALSCYVFLQQGALRDSCRFSFLPELVASVLCSPGRRLPVLVPPPCGPPKKSLRDFANLANLGHFTLRSA
jgi:hypothetical protein